MLAIPNEDLGFANLSNIKLANSQSECMELSETDKILEDGSGEVVNQI